MGKQFKTNTTELSKYEKQQRYKLKSKKRIKILNLETEQVETKKLNVSKSEYKQNQERKGEQLFYDDKLQAYIPASAIDKDSYYRTVAKYENVAKKRREIRLISDKDTVERNLRIEEAERNIQREQDKQTTKSAIPTTDEVKRQYTEPVITQIKEAGQSKEIREPKTTVQAIRDASARVVEPESYISEIKIYNEYTNSYTIQRLKESQEDFLRHQDIIGNSLIYNPERDAYVRYQPLKVMNVPVRDDVTNEVTTVPVAHQQVKHLFEKRGKEYVRKRDNITNRKINTIKVKESDESTGLQEEDVSGEYAPPFESAFVLRMNLRIYELDADENPIMDRYSDETIVGRSNERRDLTKDRQHFIDQAFKRMKAYGMDKGIMYNFSNVAVIINGEWIMLSSITNTVETDGSVNSVYNFFSVDIERNVSYSD